MSMIRIQFGVLDISVCLNDDVINSTGTDTKWHILDPINAGEGDLLLLLLRSSEVNRNRTPPSA